MWEFVTRNAAMLVLALVALACPLMHIFGHRHGGHHGGRDGRTRS
jgi:Protein of unknown function (DUF2933)